MWQSCSYLFRKWHNNDNDNFSYNKHSRAKFSFGNSFVRAKKILFKCPVKKKKRAFSAHWIHLKIRLGDSIEPASCVCSHCRLVWAHVISLSLSLSLSLTHTHVTHTFLHTCPSSPLSLPYTSYLPHSYTQTHTLSMPHSLLLWHSLSLIQTLSLK